MRIGKMNKVLVLSGVLYVIIVRGYAKGVEIFT